MFREERGDFFRGEFIFRFSLDDFKFEFFIILLFIFIKNKY